MHDLDKALDDIGSIRQHIAAQSMFRGLGPSVLATTGVLALATASLQSLMMDDPTRSPVLFIATWMATALISTALIGTEMITRSRRHHSGLADAMILNAVEQFLPSGIAGAAIGIALIQFAPDTVWILPGLWQVLVSLGLFAAVRSLPRTVTIAAVWYFVAGMTVLVIASRTGTLSPWTMGIPFAVGQMLLAVILHIAYGAEDADI